MKHLSILTLAAVATTTVTAQEVKFGKFTDQEISKTESKISADAAAEVLYSYAKYNIDFNSISNELIQTKTIHYRIKVYNKDKAPNSVLTLEIPLRNGSSKADSDKISNLKASTFIRDGKGMKEIKVEKKDRFTKDIHKYLEVETLTFPNVQDGAIIEYSYEIISPFYSSTDTWYFQDEIPVVKSELYFETSEVFKYQPDLRGQFKLTPINSSRIVKVPYIETNSTKQSSGSYDYTVNINKYTAENLPEIKNEAYVLNPRNMMSSAKFELAAYMPKNNTHTFFTSTWDKIGKDFMDHEDFGRQLNGNGFLNDKVTELTAGKTTEAEKIVSIFNYVRSNYKWNEYHSTHTDKGIKKTFNEKSGNAADINLLLVAMLQKAGINANPVVLSTVRNGMLNYSFPSRTRLNYVIASAKINENDVLMDATEFYSAPNMLPIRALNHRGILIEKDKTREVNLTNSILSNTKTQVTAVLDATGKINGTYASTRDNYFYMTDKNEIAEDPKAFEKEYLEDYTFDVESFKTQENNEGLLRHSFKFSNIQTDVAGNKIIFNPLLFTANESHQLNAESRSYNLEFGAPMNLSKTIKIKIPDGYKVESLPQGFHEKIVNDAAGYIYKTEEKEGFIITTAIRTIPYSILPADYYPHFKGMMNKVVEAETQQVVLVKQ